MSHSRRSRCQRRAVIASSRNDDASCWHHVLPQRSMSSVFILVLHLHLHRILVFSHCLSSNSRRRLCHTVPLPSHCISLARTLVNQSLGAAHTVVSVSLIESCKRCRANRPPMLNILQPAHTRLLPHPICRLNHQKWKAGPRFLHSPGIFETLCRPTFRCLRRSLRTT